MNHNQREKYLTIDEVCEMTGLAKPTIYQKNSKGKIPSIKLGKQIRFKESSILKWLNSKGNLLEKAIQEKNDAALANL